MDASALFVSSFSDLDGDQGSNLKLAEIKEPSQFSNRSSGFMGDQVLQHLLPDRNQV